MTTLRQQVFRGGAFLAGRHAAGAVIGAVGVLLLTRQIGPASYGLLVAAFSVFVYVSFVAPCGLDIYLVRREGEPDDREYHVAFTLLLAIGSVVAIGGALAMWARGQSAEQGFAPLALAMFLGMPLTLVAMVPAVRLERAMDYRRIAAIELAGVVVFQGVTLANAYAGLGAWSGVFGWWAQQVTAAALFYRAAAFRPRLCWDVRLARIMLAFGLGYSVSVWVGQLRTLVNPLIVMPLAGPAAVGYVGLAVKFVEVLSVLKSLAGRISVAALGRLNGDRARALVALTEGMRLQVLGVGAALAGFAVAGPYIMPLLFREEWAEWAPAIALFPLLALGGLANALFSLHSSILYVLGRSSLVTAFNAVYVAVLGIAALIWVPRYGIFGVGYAEVAAIATYGVLHVFVKRAVGVPAYGVAVLWAAAAGLLLFNRTLGWVTVAGVVVALLWPTTWRTLDGYVRALRPRRERLGHA
jgi:PST family polysaccharide transporter